jgi:hypothetical protein
VTTHPEILYTGNGLKIQSINGGNCPTPDKSDLSVWQAMYRWLNQAGHPVQFSYYFGRQNRR